MTKLDFFLWANSGSNMLRCTMKILNAMMAINWWCYGYPENLNVFITIVPVKRAILRLNLDYHFGWWSPHFLLVKPPFHRANPWWMPLVAYPRCIPILSHKKYIKYKKIAILSLNPENIGIHKPPRLEKTWEKHDILMISPYSILLPPPLRVRSSSLSPGDAPAAPGPAAPRGNLRASKVAETQLGGRCRGKFRGNILFYIYLYICIVVHY